MFSYDPANDDTRHAAGALTFEFKQRLVFTTVLKILSTQGKASAAVKPVDDSVFGRGGLSLLIGPNAVERDLYAVEPGDEGDALVAALCPGSKHGWMAFGRIRANRDLRVHVLGDGPDGGRPRLCRTLDFSFHGEWVLPRTTPEVTEGQMKRPHFPY